MRSLRFCSLARLAPALLTAALLTGLESTALLAAEEARAPSAADEVDAEALARSVTVYRDEWGVPHIDGPTDESVCFAFAYCQAQDYFWQLEDSYILGLGRYAESTATRYSRETF
jgi:acyl-homoserine-lactone acylase